ncbi:MAG: hypothetical protein IJ753_06340 [Bacteroidales bacterium]|nr:hypothetical protein [Bacteroidales bacterium]
MRTELDRITENEYARKEGEAAGIKKGIEKEKKEMAQKFRDLGVDPKIIQQATGFTKEQMEAL